MRVTLEDIAKRANVSPSTVSRVISNNPNISVETKKKVMSIIESVNFQPNIVARSLANKSTKTIGLLTSSRTGSAYVKVMRHPQFVDLLAGIAQTAYKNGYNLLMSSLDKTMDDKAKIRELANGGMTDGLIYNTVRVNDEIIEELRKLKTNCVVIGKPENDDGINWIDNDNFEAAYDLTQYMISKGKRNIAFLDYSANFVVSIERFRGYKQALIDNGIPFNEKLQMTGKLMTDDGYELMGRLLARGVKVDGIISQDDLIAIGAIKRIKEYNLRVPEDIAVCGFYNIPMCEYSNPPLTSVDINAYELGAQACDMLISVINGEQPQKTNKIVKTNIIIRKSI